MDDLRIIMYHYVRELAHSRYPSIKGLDVTQFRQQLEFLNEHFHVIRMEELISYYKESYQLPKKSVLLTFDDGYIDNYLYVLPILDDLGLQGSFFIPGKTFIEHKLLDVNKIHYVLASSSIGQLTEELINRMDYYRGKEFEYPKSIDLYNSYAIANRFDDKNTIFVKRMLQTVLPEKLRNLISSELFAKYVGISEDALAYELYMTYDQINILYKKNMFIGVHGYDHYWLGNLADEDMKRDIDRAISVLDCFIDKSAWVMNYPYGSYNDCVVEYVRKKGSIIGLSTNVNVVNLNNDNRYYLPRLDCNDFPPMSEGYRIIGA